MNKNDPDPRRLPADRDPPRSFGRDASFVALASVQIAAVAVWAGGLVALGAIAAPLVFGIVPAPYSADAMTAVFRRFDSIAVTCALVVLAADAVRTIRAGDLHVRYALRSSTFGAAAVLASVQAVWLSPAIDSLHRSGAIRGLGEAGLALEKTHRYAELFGKWQLGLLMVGIVFLVGSLVRPKPAIKL